MSLISRLENYNLDINGIIDNEYLKSHHIGNKQTYMNKYDLYDSILLYK